MRPFSLRIQRDLVLALSILFNVIRLQEHKDTFADRINDILSDDSVFLEIDNENPNRGSSAAQRWRDSIATKMWDDYVQERRNRNQE
jgi:hypothetical protein